MHPHPLERYLADCSARRSTHALTPETSLYPPLEALLTAAGAGLKPRVVAFMNLKNLDGTMPDGGLFTPDQLLKGDHPLQPGQVPTPARGVVECKPPEADVLAVANTKQVSKYWDRYNQVLVTNYREFVLVGRDDKGKPVKHEYYRLAPTADDFWALAADPKAAAAGHGPRLLDFLRRCLRRPAPLTEPKDLAWFLASYAREARSRIERNPNPPNLAAVRTALESALGLHVADAEGEHFFRSTLVQTLFYGLFAAWVLWHHDTSEDKDDRFQWQLAGRYIAVPVLRKLFAELVGHHTLKGLNLLEVMRWAGDTLDRVQWEKFSEKFNEAEAVQYFYEPFLEAFDPELRKQLGVWYTPPEIVRYMVGRVNQVLKDENTFNLKGGLANPNVIVLDPCCGTGAYLVEVVNAIAAELRAMNKGDATFAATVKQAALDRVFGFEILPAPFVIAHLQLGLLFQKIGVPLDEKERAKVFLTNALTGWHKDEPRKKTPPFPEMSEERDAADAVKQTTPILVVLGNPPYNGFAGLPADEDRGLVEPYRETTAGIPKPEGQGLNDLYVRFFRIAERCITERGRQHGVVCYISNYSWLDGRSHTGLRARFLGEFDRVWIDSLNGDKYKTGKLTPEGEPDPSVFSTPHNREGIQVGTAVALLARTPEHAGPAEVWFRDFWGEDKRAGLLKSLTGAGTEGDNGPSPGPLAPLAAHPLPGGERVKKDRRSRPSPRRGEGGGASPPGEGVRPTPTTTPPPPPYHPVAPIPALGLAFRPMQTEAAYTAWPLLPELFPTYFPGVQTKQDPLVTDIDRARLVARMEDYFNPKVSDVEMARRHPTSMDGTDACDPVPTRTRLVKRGFLPRYIVKYAYRPFDVRWLYWEPETKLLGRPVPEYFRQVDGSRQWIVCQKMPRREWKPPQLIRALGCIDLMDRSASCLTWSLSPTEQAGLFQADELNSARKLGEHLANLSDEGLAYLGTVGGGVADAPHLFHHAVAVMHAPRYAAQNASALRQDWPRIPLPASREALLASAALGRQVAALLDPEADVTFTPAVGTIAVPTKVGGKNMSGSDFDVTARWGIAGKGGITMPSTGKTVGRAFTDEERAALQPSPLAGEGGGASPPGEGSSPSAPSLLGPDTLDVYLNDAAYWKNVPRKVWEYHLGGYQVLKKWLSYRKKAILGRGLRPEEVHHVRDTARRIAILLLLGPELDANYAAVAAAGCAWPPPGAPPG